MKSINTPAKGAAKATLGAAAIAAVGVFTAASATASPTIQGLGTSETLVDGPIVTDYTMGNLQPADITIPGYTPKGQIWQAEVNARASSGLVRPVVSDFNARTSDNLTICRVMSTSPTPVPLARRLSPRAARPTGRFTST